VAEVTVNLGTKLSEQEQQNVDRTKAVWLTAQPPPDADVSGQYCYCGAHICPWCGSVGWDTGQQQPWHIIICYCCGRAFTA
jgi:hypothetical protein